MINIINNMLYLIIVLPPHNAHTIWLAFPADIGRKPASQAHGSRQRLHTSESRLRTRRLMKRPI